MSLARPTLRRAMAMTALAVGCALAPTGAALAHNGTGGSSSDYRIEIDGWRGDHTGVELRVVELGNRLELRRTTAASVTVLGYSGEPYLRLDASGVAENVNSPAHYLNRDRFASTNPPPTATADAQPSWTVLSTGSTIRWHDHRAHWMSSTPRADVLADPDSERVIFPANAVDLVVDGRAVAALIKVTWLPTPKRLIWLGAAAALGLVVAAGFVLRPKTKPWVPPVALIGSVAALAGQGASSTRHLFGLVVIAVAVAAVALRRPLVATGAAVGAGVLAATRIEAFEHELLAGWPAGVVQRVALVVAIALSLGVVAAAIVGALEPTPVEDPAR